MRRFEVTLAAPGHNHSEGMHSAEDPLVAILTDMVKSASTWEAHKDQDIENSHQDQGLTPVSRHIHCPSLDNQAEQELSESEDEDGHRNQEQ